MALEATPGSPTANSFVTIDRATAILHTRLHTEPWFAAQDNQEREAALIWATRLQEEQVAWYGYPATVTQALSFPMVGLVDRYGRVVSSLTIPRVIEESTACFALALLRDQREALMMASTGNVKSRKVGDTTIVYQDAPGAWEPPVVTTLPAEIRQMLMPYGRVAGSVMVPLLRG